MTAPASFSATAKVPYRRDIDGLRALAVLAVLGFHFRPGDVPGGFVGVDIFFVISGFLITRLILDDLAKRRFSVRDFYGRRIRRIFPALAVVLVACAIVGWLFLFPSEWQRLARHLFAGAAFVSNLALMREGGYFDWAAHLKPLLHLWSLGVEEQFYFVWPLLLLFLWRLRRWGAHVLLLILGASFLLNLLLIDRYPAYTFYLPLTRLWELGCGSVLAWDSCRRGGLVLPRLAREAFSILGLLLAAFAILTFREQGFPGFLALVPVAASLALIAAGPDAVVNRTLLASPAAVGIGLISYPLYLWHWPLLAFLKIFRRDEPDAWLAVACGLAAFLLAYGTYVFIERPVRNANVSAPRLKLVAGTVAVVGLLGIAGMTGVLRARLDSPEATRILAASSDWSYPFGDNFGRTDGFILSRAGRQGSGSTLFIGDSHMEQYWPRIALQAKGGRSHEVWFATNGGCPPLRGLGRQPVCDRFLNFALEQAKHHAVRTVVFGAAWPSYLPEGAEEKRAGEPLERFSEDIAALVQAGKRVYVILAGPVSQTFDPVSMVSRLDGRVEPPAPLPLVSVRAKGGRAAAAVREAALRAGARVIDPLPYLCAAGGSCPGWDPRHGPIYKDASHLRPWFVRERAGFIDPVFAP